VLLVLLLLLYVAGVFADAAVGTVLGQCLLAFPHRHALLMASFGNSSANILLQNGIRASVVTTVAWWPLEIAQ
jgi:hypothetical protein